MTMAEQPRKPYLDGGKSIGEMFRAHVRWLKQSNVKESQAEKPYLGGPYPKMHLNWPGMQWDGLNLKDLQLGEGGIGSPSKHTYIFPPPRCSLFVSFITCKELEEGSANIWFTPPSTLQSSYSWQVESHTDGAEVTGVKVSGRLRELLDFSVEVTDEDLTEATICARAKFSGQASTRLVSYGPPGFAPPKLGSLWDTAPIFSEESGYSSLLVDCGCVTTPVDCTNCEEICSTVVSIGYTTQQMAASGTQTLTLEGADYEPDCHTWAIKSGGGSLGNPDANGDVVYTAPATNAECANNPVIALYCDEVEHDSLSIAVNVYAGGENAAQVWSNKRCVDAWPWNCYIDARQYLCDGSLNAGFGNPCTLGRQSAGGACPGCYSQNGPPANCDSGNVSMDDLEARSPDDLRTAAMKTAGCCPEQLL